MRSDFTGKTSCSKIPDDEGVDARVAQSSQICGKRFNIIVVHDDIERHVYLDVMSVSIANCRRNLLECEIARALAHTEAVACQVHGISAEAHRILQLLESACRCKKLHGYLPFP